MNFDKAKPPGPHLRDHRGTALCFWEADAKLQDAREALAMLRSDAAAMDRPVDATRAAKLEGRVKAAQKAVDAIRTGASIPAHGTWPADACEACCAFARRYPQVVAQSRAA